VSNRAPRYPIYVPSKGRWQPGRALTARCLANEGVPFSLVVEPHEADRYADAFGAERVIVLPSSDQGLMSARNWIKAHATAGAHERHWQLDDNMAEFRRQYRGKRIQCPAAVALRVVEDFTDRYANVGVSGMTYTMFGWPHLPPFQVNCHVYSCTLVNNAIPHAWRCRYNDDTDLCLQVIADGWCTVLVNAVQVNKMATMTVKGGNTDDLYQGDGRRLMAESLTKQWPGIATVRWRYGRPQHHVNWQQFRTPLKLKPDVDLANLESDEYGLRLAAVGDVKSPRLRQLLAHAA
jgi:hypothetical protein